MAGETRLLPANPWVPHRPLTVAEYHRMGEVGILTEDDRVELIEGELIAMSPVGSDHAGTANTLTRVLVMAVGERGVVAVGNPVQLDDLIEPQPDFTVLKPKPDDYRSGTPRPSDVLLVVEIADSSLAYDRTIKRALHARMASRSSGSSTCGLESWRSAATRRRRTRLGWGGAGGGSGAGTAAGCAYPGLGLAW